MTRTWYLLRHGETEWNRESRLQGQLDSTLTGAGRDQARASAALLSRLGVDVIYASPLGRARETVALLRERLAQPVIFDDRLKEWSGGDWSGELHAEIRVKWPAEWAAWDADRFTNRSPAARASAIWSRARRRSSTTSPRRHIRALPSSRTGS